MASELSLICYAQGETPIPQAGGRLTPSRGNALVTLELGDPETVQVAMLVNGDGLIALGDDEVSRRGIGRGQRANLIAPSR